MLALSRMETRVRRSAFERDFRDVHGEPPPRRRHPHVEIVQEQRLPVNRLLFAFVLGSLGLFWTLVLGVVVAAMLFVGGVFVWAMFHPAPIPG